MSRSATSGVLFHFARQDIAKYFHVFNNALMLKVFDLVIHIFSENGEMILPLGLNWNFHEKDVFLEVPI